MDVKNPRLSKLPHKQENRNVGRNRREHAGRAS